MKKQVPLILTAKITTPNIGYIVDVGVGDISLPLRLKGFEINFKNYKESWSLYELDSLNLAASNILFKVTLSDIINSISEKFGVGDNDVFVEMSHSSYKALIQVEALPPVLVRCSC